MKVNRTAAVATKSGCKIFLTPASLCSMVDGGCCGCCVATKRETGQAPQNSDTKNQKPMPSIDLQALWFVSPTQKGVSQLLFSVVEGRGNATSLSTRVAFVAQLQLCINPRFKLHLEARLFCFPANLHLESRLLRCYG